jgi:RNA 3'-terminal phosphate cyclase (ATP)
MSGSDRGQGTGAVGEAAVEGAEVGARTLTFVPRSRRGGQFSFAIGTAGSTMLVLQKILLPLLMAPEPSTVQRRHRSISSSTRFFRCSSP